MLTGSSGNGYHILPYLDLPNTPESTALVKTVQLHLKAKFDAPGVKIDCFEDPNRLTRLYFTRNCKGIESEGRSYWMSKIIHAPENRVVISRELLEKAAKLCPVPVQIREVYDTKEGNCETWMLEEFLIARNWEYSPYGDNAFEVADPWEHEHHTPRGSGTVTVSCINGKFGYSCLRDGCKTFHDVENGVIRKRTWHDFRDAIDPEHEYKFPVEIEPVDLAGNGIELDDTDEAAPEKPAPVTDVGFNPEPTPEKRQHSQPVLEPETIEEFEAEEAAENTEAKADDAVVESEMPPSEVDLTFPESALYGKLSSPSVLSPRPSYDKTLSAGRWIELRGIAEPFRPPPTSKPAIFRIAAVLPCCAFVIT
jgi:hypothetical protein